MQYLIKVSLLLIISKMLCLKIKQINRFNICEKVNDIFTIGQFKRKQDEIIYLSLINRQ